VFFSQLTNSHKSTKVGPVVHLVATIFPLWLVKEPYFQIVANRRPTDSQQSYQTLRFDFDATLYRSRLVIKSIHSTLIF